MAVQLIRKEKKRKLFPMRETKSSLAMRQQETMIWALGGNQQFLHTWGHQQRALTDRAHVRSLAATPARTAAAALAHRTSRAPRSGSCSPTGHHAGPPRSRAPRSGRALARTVTCRPHRRAGCASAHVSRHRVEPCPSAPPRKPRRHVGCASAQATLAIRPLPRWRVVASPLPLTCSAFLVGEEEDRCSRRKKSELGESEKSDIYYVKTVALYKVVSTNSFLLSWFLCKPACSFKYWDCP